MKKKINKSAFIEKVPYLVLLFIATVIVYRIYEAKREDKLLEKSKNTTAVLIDIRSGKAVRSTASGTYKYKIGNKFFEYEESRNFNDLKMGDTLLIEYSIEDPSVARVVDKYYMQKYKNLKQ